MGSSDLASDKFDRSRPWLRDFRKPNPAPMAEGWVMRD